MTRGIKENEPDARVLYADIIDLPHYHVPGKAYMSDLGRAAQFSAFNALDGYEEMVDEEARQVGTQDTLSETEIEILNQKLSLIADVIEDGYKPEVTFTYFVPDARKHGGEYCSLTAKVRRIDIVNRQIALCTKVGVSGSYQKIEMDRVKDISGELVDHIE